MCIGLGPSDSSSESSPGSKSSCLTRFDLVNMTRPEVNSRGVWCKSVNFWSEHDQSTRVRIGTFRLLKEGGHFTMGEVPLYVEGLGCIGFRPSDSPSESSPGLKSSSSDLPEIHLTIKIQRPLHCMNGRCIVIRPAEKRIYRLQDQHVTDEDPPQGLLFY